MMIALFYLVFVLLIGLLIKWRWHEYQRLNKLKWAPVLEGEYPILGNVLKINRDPKGYLKLFDGFLKSSESGTVILPAFIYTGVCTINADLFEHTLSSTEMLAKADVYKFFFRWLGKGLITASGDKWKTRRRLLTPTFHNSVMESYTDTMDRNAHQFLDNLKEKLGNESFDIFPYVNLCTLNIVCETMMGTSLDNDNNLLISKTAYSEQLEEVCHLVSSRLFSLYKSVDILYSFSKDCEREIKLTNTLHEFTKMVIDKKRKQLKTDGPEDHDVCFNGGKKNRRKAVLDLLLELKLDGEPLSDEEIREHVDTFMFAGHDTTASAISFALYCLSRHPEAQQKAFEEQREIFGSDKNRPVTNEDLKNMPYLELVIKESMRLYPPVPFIARNVDNDSDYKGNTIPKGTFILLFIYGLHRNPKYFENPEEFIPERFEKELKHQYSYIPFGSGLRGCMGKQYTMMEIKCILARFLQNYEILPPTPEKDIHLIGQTVIKSSTGIHCSIRKRHWK